MRLPKLRLPVRQGTLEQYVADLVRALERRDEEIRQQINRMEVRKASKGSGAIGM